MNTRIATTPCAKTNEVASQVSLLPVAIIIGKLSGTFAGIRQAANPVRSRITADDLRDKSQDTNTFCRPRSTFDPVDWVVLLC